MEKTKQNIVNKPTGECKRSVAVSKRYSGGVSALERAKDLEGCIGYNVRVKECADGTAVVTFANHPIRYGKDKSDSAMMYSDVWCDDSVETPWGDYAKEVDDFAVDKKLPITKAEIDKRRERSLRNSLNRTKSLAYDYSHSYVWDYFITITISPRNANRYELKEVKKLVSRFFKNYNLSHCCHIKYMLIPEQHKDGAWHFHGFLADCDDCLKICPWKKHGVQRTSPKSGQPLYTVPRMCLDLGWTTCEKILDTRKAASYILKYVTKDLCEIGKGQQRLIKSKKIAPPTIWRLSIEPKTIIKMISKLYQENSAKASVWAKNVHVDNEGYVNDFVHLYCTNDMVKQYIYANLDDTVIDSGIQWVERCSDNISLMGYQKTYDIDTEGNINPNGYYLCDMLKSVNLEKEGVL